MLPEKAQYDYLANLPESENLAEAINEAMKLIEADYEELAGYFLKITKTLLQKMIRIIIYCPIW